MYYVLCIIIKMDESTVTNEMYQLSRLACDIEDGQMEEEELGDGQMEELPKKSFIFGYKNNLNIVLQECFIELSIQLTKKIIIVSNSNVLKHTINVIIDGFPCIMNIIINDDQFWDIDIKDRQLVNHADDTDHEEVHYSYFNCSSVFDCCYQNKYKDFTFTINNLAEFLQDIYYVLLEELIFDKVSGKFIYKITSDIRIAEVNCFAKFIETPKLETCCVCLSQETETKTPCGHTLCFPCWIQLKNKVCPLCRCSVRYVKNYDSDDDDDDEN